MRFGKLGFGDKGIHEIYTPFSYTFESISCIPNNQHISANSEYPSGTYFVLFHLLNFLPQLAVIPVIEPLMYCRNLGFTLIFIGGYPVRIYFSYLKFAVNMLFRNSNDLYK